MLQGPQGIEQVREHGYAVFQPSQDGSEAIDEGDWLQALISELETQALVLDVRTDLAVEAIRQIRAEGVLIVTIDDASDRRLAADLAFYPPVPQVERLDWTGFTGKRFIGWDWVLLGPEFARCRMRVANKAAGDKTDKKNQTVPLDILVTMGGSDPAGLTLMALKALDQIDQDLHVTVVLGRGYLYELELQQWLSHARRYYVFRRNVQDMPATMAEVDLAIASFGVTAYELAVMGVPTIYYCLSNDHSESASAFVNAGVAVDFGHYYQINVDASGEIISGLIKDSYRRVKMRQAALNLIDGWGAYRISKAVSARVV